MENIIYIGTIVSPFTGFYENAVFKMNNGVYWIQSKYTYWYHYAYRPKAVIAKESDQCVLTVAEHSVPVKRLNDVIESQIDGTFEGWDGNKTYKLTNGQVWQQAEYKYEYKYAYRPDVVIYNIGGRYIMAVDGTIAYVRRV